MRSQIIFYPPLSHDSNQRPRRRTYYPFSPSCRSSQHKLECFCESGTIYTVNNSFISAAQKLLNLSLERASRRLGALCQQWQDCIPRTFKHISQFCFSVSHSWQSLQGRAERKVSYGENSRCCGNFAASTSVKYKFSNMSLCGVPHVLQYKHASGGKG